MLEVTLPANWHPAPEEKGASYAAFRRGSGPTRGLLQCSIALYEGGKIPDPSSEELVRQAQEYGARVGYGQPLAAAGGTCNVGRLGTALFSPSPDSILQLWFLGHPRGMVLVTYACPNPLQAGELEEVRGVVESMAFRPE